MTLDQIKQLWNYNITKVIKPRPDWRYLHGMILGMDSGGLYGEFAGADAALMTTEVDSTQWHFLIKDENIEDKKLKIDLATGKSLDQVILKFHSSEAKEIEQTIQTWLDPTFKFKTNKL